MTSELLPNDPIPGSNGAILFDPALTGAAAVSAIVRRAGPPMASLVDACPPGAEPGAVVRPGP
jgi:hypothetical protein